MSLIQREIKSFLATCSCIKGVTREKQQKTFQSVMDEYPCIHAKAQKLLTQDNKYRVT